MESAQEATKEVTQDATANGWHTISRRKYHDKRHGALNPTYMPYKAKPLYSQIHLFHNQSAQNPSNKKHQHPTIRAPFKPAKNNTMADTPPSSPPTSPTYYFSPHSPTQLRFPPSPHFLEWHGRCFRCCRIGHSAAVCRNPKKCGKYWGEGHVGAHCQASTLNPATMPYWGAKNTQQPGKSTTGETKLFHDLLNSPTPLAGPTMPSDRPRRLTYFSESDQATLRLCSN